MVLFIKQLENVKINKPVLIEGLPGIGNVGKIAADFIIDSIKARKIFEIRSYGFPNAVFVNDKNLIELPAIDIYHKKVNGTDILILAGDIQPIDEESCYEFCDKVLDFLEKNNGKEIITLGGIGLPEIPEEPKAYCTATNKKIIERYKYKNLSNNIYGVVGPIIGVTGILAGLAGKRNMEAIALLAETYGHPNYIGIKGARAILRILDGRFKLDLNFKVLDRNVVEIEKDMKEKIKQIDQIMKKSSVRKMDETHKTKTNYIG